LDQHKGRIVNTQIGIDRTKPTGGKSISTSSSTRKCENWRGSGGEGSGVLNGACWRNGGSARGRSTVLSFGLKNQGKQKPNKGDVAHF
jgi:hypothetical protein